MIKFSILNNKKIILFISIISLASICLLIPTSLGYGHDFHSAETLTNGTHYDTLASDDDYAYYKVFCNPGDVFTVTITVDYPPNMLFIYLYDPEYDYEANGGTSDYGTDTVNCVCDQQGSYYIRLRRYEPDTGQIPMTIEISGATGSAVLPAVPGFQLIALLIGAISISGLLYLRRKRQIKISK